MCGDFNFSCCQYIWRWKWYGQYSHQKLSLIRFYLLVTDHTVSCSILTSLMHYDIACIYVYLFIVHNGWARTL